MGPSIRYEPKNLDTMCENREFFSIFREVGWIEYFQRLNGFHEETTFQFSMNLNGDHLEIIGLRIDVSERDLS